MSQSNLDHQRAQRILFTMNICNESLDNIYESLVDRDFDFAAEEIRNVIVELRLILKSIPEDDF
jgi:hypothetical protein